MGPGNSFPGANLLTKTFNYFVDLQLIWSLPLCDSAVSTTPRGSVRRPVASGGVYQLRLIPKVHLFIIMWSFLLTSALQGE